ncbi:FtsX-like permease family protein [Paraliomyxa miuraensis]|uniref:FtsX-like permease family protein n=1 Tax=Paraliomyxa miuraensis TaxID=376150 RepID=UPI0022551C09|nr:FtsX-like permease family protein [Paraliomyxa miuraensis]MCX4244616.1 ABC transporter permease [Paraliomyxa miuraensis]
MSAWLFTRLDWIIAWRHLRMGDERPVWVMPLIIGAIYLMLVGGGMAWYASTLDVGVGPEVMGGGYEVPGTDMGPTPLQQYYGAFGGLTLVIGLMALVFGLLSFFFNLLPTIITMSVLLGCMALVVVLSLMSGLEGDLRDKILNQKAHIRVSRADGRPFPDYLPLADAIAQVPEVAGASPYLEGEIMVRSGLNRQGAILTGILPDRHTTVTNLPSLVREGDYAYLDDPAAIPDPDPLAVIDDKPWRLRHLEGIKGKPGKSEGKSDEAGAKGESPAGKLPKGDPLGALPRLGKDPLLLGPSEDTGDDGGWEDPAVEIPKLRDEGVLPPPPPSDDGASDDAANDDQEDEWAADGWEDPEVEIPKLRQEGVLPPAPDGGDEADDGGEGESSPPRDEPREPKDELGSLVDDADVVLEPVLVGRELSMELSVGVGAQVQLITPVGRLTPAGRIPGQLWTKVAAVFFSGMYEYDRKNVYAPLRTVQKFLLVGDRVTGIEIKLHDIEAVDAGKAAVSAVVSAQGRDDEIIVEDWRDLNRNLFSAMFLEKVAMFIALLFVVLVASFGILASNLMSVMEKAKEIAILKAMGTRDAGILRVFIAEGLCVGILGSFGGIAMGLGLCWALDRFGLPLNENVYYIEKLPVVVNPVEVALVGVAALIIVCFSSLYPALVASRLRPVDGLRQAD